MDKLADQVDVPPVSGEDEPSAAASAPVPAPPAKPPPKRAARPRAAAAKTKRAASKERQAPKPKPPPGSATSKPAAAPRKPKPTGRKPAPKPPSLVETKAVHRPTETCVTVWWREGMRSDFYAVATGANGREYIAARSPEFEWVGGDVPVEAGEAHHLLVTMLVQDGWRPVDTEGPWYRRRFERQAGRGAVAAIR